MTSSTSYTRIARTLSKIDIFWWFFHQNARRTFWFPTRYHMMWFQKIFKISIFPAVRRPGPARSPDRRVEIFFRSKSPRQYFRKSQEVWIPVYDSFRNCWQKYSAAGHFDPPPVIVGLKKFLRKLFTWLADWTLIIFLKDYICILSFHACTGSFYLKKNEFDFFRHQIIP